jgi:hypothetical protein
MILRYLLLLLVLSSASLAQSFQWLNTVPLDIQTNPAYLHSPVVLDNSGNPVSARLVNFRELYSTAYYGDIEITKISSSGSVIWADTAYGKADVSEIIVDGENNVICIGTFRDTLQIYNSRLIYTGQDVGSFLLKLDSAGNVTWLKDGADYITQFGAITALARDGQNNILLGVGNYPVEANVLILNSSGDQVSEIVQSNIGTVSNMRRDNSGNIWVTGFSFGGDVSFNGFDTIAPFGYNEYVVKYDPSGSAQWVKFIQDVTVQFYEIELDNAGNAYLGGSLFDSTSFGNLHANGPQWLYDFFVTKIDPNGNFVWLNEIPPGNPTGDGFAGNDNFLSCSGDGQTYFTGTYRGKLDFGNDIILYPLNYTNIFVLSYDSEGALQWAKSAGDSPYDQASSAASDENGNCYISGLVGEHFKFDTLLGSGGNYNLYLAKLKTENPVSVEGGSGNNLPAGSFSLMQNYPNPFNPSTNLSFVIGSASFVSLKIYDPLGREVQTLINEYKPAGQYTVTWDAASSGRWMPSGVYFYKLRAGSNVQVRKMLLLK